MRTTRKYAIEQKTEPIIKTSFAYDPLNIRPLKTA